MGHFARNCPKPRENANIARESEQNRKFGELMDFGDSSVCEECAMICTDIYSDEEYEDLIVYSDQGISTKTYDEETYGDLLKTDSDEAIVKYNLALCAQDSMSLEKKRRRLNRDIPSEAESQLSLINKENDTVPYPTNNNDDDESQKAWTMGMPTNDGDISMIDSEELTRIKDKNKKFLYAWEVHANHMIQYHMNEISERQRVVDQYRSMAYGGRDMIPLESDKYKSDLVVNQHMMQMINTDIHWYEQTFREIITELRKIQNGETPMRTSEEPNKTAMMCWESLDDPEQASKKRKMHVQDDETNDNNNEIDDKTPTVPKRTTTMEKHLNIPVGELRLGADGDASTLATQENPEKNLVYITNMPEGTLETTENVSDPSKNTNEQDDKKPSPVEKTDQVTSNDQLNAYEESDRDEDSKKVKEFKKNTWRTRKIIHMEFESDDDMDKQAKNSNSVKMEGKVRVEKRIIHYYEISSDKEEGKHADPKKVKKTQDGHENQPKNGENDQALVSNEMTVSSIGNNIFIGDSAATSHMTNNWTGVNDFVPIRGSVMIGNGESISCTQKGKLDVICKHKDGLQLDRHGK